MVAESSDARADEEATGEGREAAAAEAGREEEAAEAGRDECRSRASAWRIFA